MLYYTILYCDNCTPLDISRTWISVLAHIEVLRRFRESCYVHGAHCVGTRVETCVHIRWARCSRPDPIVLFVVAQAVACIWHPGAALLGEKSNEVVAVAVATACCLYCMAAHGSAEASAGAAC